MSVLSGWRPNAGVCFGRAPCSAFLRSWAQRTWQRTGRCKAAAFHKMTQCWVRRKETELTQSSLESKVTVARRISGNTKLGRPLGVTAGWVSLPSVLHTLPSVWAWISDLKRKNAWPLWDCSSCDTFAWAAYLRWTCVSFWSSSETEGWQSLPRTVGWGLTVLIPVQ